MNKLDLIISKERFKFYSKTLIPVIALLLVLLSSLIMRISVGEPKIRECDVVSKGTNFSYDGNSPYVICELSSNEIATVFSPKTSRLNIGDRIKVREQPLLFWYNNGYSYIYE
jgi:hypothetical protein